MELMKKVSASGGSGKTVTYVGGGVAGSNLATSVTCNFTAAQAGDFIIYVATHGSHTTNPPGTPTGYTAFGNLYASASDRNCNMMSGYRRATGGESSITFSTGGTAYGVSVVVKVFRNVNVASPFDVARTTWLGNGIEDPNPPASLTPVSRGCMLVAVGGSYQWAGTGQTYSQSSLTNFNSVSANGDFYDSASGMGILALPDLNAFNPGAWNFSQPAGADSSSAAATMILRPE